ncbi:MAG: homocysteine biosynthesis protein [candidate division WOR-3 bacterium]
MPKTIEEINEKIKKGKAVVFTAEEIIDFVKEKGLKKAAREVDVVTTGTFGPMCSSGVFINLGHTKPRMRITRAWLNDVEVFCGIAAVDMYIGATQIPDYDPANTQYPGRFKYGGGHLIEDLVAGKRIKIKAVSYGTDCYPRKELKGEFTIREINNAILFNPRNCYQNYNVAVNLGKEKIYTYMGILKPNLGNANYCSAGQLSPLLNDPEYLTIGIGTRIFLGGGIGYIVGHGTQHDPSVPKNEKGVPKSGSGTLAVIGDLKQMKPEWLRGTSITGYGVSLTVGIGIPIPILDEDILRYTCVTDHDIIAPIVDYSYDYPNLTGRIIGEIDYASLKSGKIKIGNKLVPTFPLSSYPRARQICSILKSWIKSGKFYLTQPVARLPGHESGIKFRPFRGRYR